MTIIEEPPAPSPRQWRVSIGDAEHVSMSHAPGESHVTLTISTREGTAAVPISLAQLTTVAGAAAQLGAAVAKAVQPGPEPKSDPEGTLE